MGKDFGEPLPGGTSGIATSEQQALDALFDLTYMELRRMARSVKGADPGMTLNPTALVNEAWLKLRASPAFAQMTPLHFKRIAARAMRQILVDAARRRGALKRGAAVTATVSVDIESTPAAGGEMPVLALEEALTELAQIEPRQALVVESRFFGGFENEELAELLGVSAATVQREWRTARAWLQYRLRDGKC